MYLYAHIWLCIHMCISLFTTGKITSKKFNKVIWVLRFESGLDRDMCCA